MSFIVDPRVEEYAEAHSSPEGDLFERLAAETHEKTTAPQMMVGRIEGRFLGVLVRSLRARRVLELGTFTGYSSIAMALALPSGGRVITCDVNEETTAIARRYAEEAGVADRIDYRLGPGLETIAQLDGPFDLVFIDADKPNYVNYYEATLPLLGRRRADGRGQHALVGPGGRRRLIRRTRRRRFGLSTTTCRMTLASRTCCSPCETG